MTSPARRQAGLRICGRGIARGGYGVLSDGKVIGVTTSGTFCPYLGYAAAMALIDAKYARLSNVSVDIRGKSTEALIVPLPFYNKKETT
jgi:aminomethyltransferase